MSAATLRGKVNPNTDRNLLSLQEADTLMGRTGDYRILHALCAEHGFIAQRVDAPQSGNLITALLSAAAAKGDLAELISEAMADNRITQNEADAIARACQQVMAALVQVSQHAEAAAERGGV
ncbi:UNVERIFIED_ORG: hypothetical protein ABIC77_000315 [Stenotrophomonas geniculata]